MKIKEAMTTNVRIAKPDQTIREAAKAMAEVDSGVLPVGENDRLVGMITDRDIAVRGVGEGKGPETRVREVMTDHVDYCFQARRRAHHPAHIGPNERFDPAASRDR
jgi:CBS domain-containing protein